MRLYPVLRPFLFALGAEAAHRATIAALKFLPLHSAHLPPSVKTTLAGLDFPSPVGLAAGFDKDAEVAAEMLTLGFGFVEVGTLTPRAQAGNAKPRLFRLAEDRAVINRMGFNNEGQAAAFMRLSGCSRLGGPIGVNIGANKDSPDRVG
ncbi:MAG TPA: dihydroorotate dehydrogenase (quinone), partial [Sphingomicrobium sp.]|nr:dihydroorotate dehydrogenase (quinone) [Sphingomicrobium sp.]